jgi:hypothetical protein
MLVATTTPSASTSPSSGNHQVRREARPDPMAQVLRPLHRECWWQQ